MPGFRATHGAPVCTLALLAGLAVVFVHASGVAESHTPESTPSQSPVLDMHSYARPGEARVTHVALDLRADFTKRIVSGTATLTLDISPGASEVVLDTKDLAIEAVTGDGGKALQQIGRAHV